MIEESAPKPGLRKVAKAKFWELRPAVLYFDDIEAIYGLFRRVSDSVTLRLDGYELDSPAYAAQLKSTETEDFEINCRGREPVAEFEAHAHRFWFYASDGEDLALIGLEDSIMEILHRRRLWAPIWRIMALWWLLLLAPTLVGLLLAGSWVVVALLGQVAASVICGGAAVIAMRNRFYRSGRVILQDSHAKSSFLWANRDQLVLVGLSVVGTLATTIVGGVIVYGILYAVGWVGKP